MEILELRPRLHLVRMEFGQVYLWRDADALTLIDTGVVGSGPSIAEATLRLGLDPSAIQRIVLTHGHEDHSGSAAEVRSWHGAPVHAHEADVAVITGRTRRGEPVLTSFDQPIWAGISVPEAPQSTVDVVLHGGETLDFAGGARILAIPGHTPGSIAIHLPEHRVVFTGDTVAATPTGEVILGVFNLDEDAMLDAFHRVATLDIETACFGHGDPVITDAGAILRKAAAEHQPRQRI